MMSFSNSNESRDSADSQEALQQDLPRSQSLRRTTRRRLLVCGVIACVAATCMLPFDIPLARFTRAGQMPGDLRTLFRLAEAFSHGYGAFLILLGIAIVNRLPRREFLLMAGCTYLPGLLVNVVKISIARQRPVGFTERLPDSVFDTFVGLGGVWTGDASSAFDRTFQSFPSGHTATAAGLAVALSLRFPRGVWYFSSIACLAAWQRIDAGAHFLSDTFVAAGIACFVGAWLARYWPTPTARAASSTTVSKQPSAIPQNYPAISSSQPDARVTAIDRRRSA